MAALQSALSILSPGGIITLLAYMHPEGKAEYDALSNDLKSLESPYDVYQVKTMNHQQAPILFVITKKEE